MTIFLKNKVGLKLLKFLIFEIYFLQIFFKYVIIFYINFFYEKILFYFLKFLLAIIFVAFVLIFFPYFLIIFLVVFPIILPIYAFIDGLINNKFSLKNSTKFFLFFLAIVYIFCLGFWVYILGWFLDFIDNKDFLTVGWFFVLPVSLVEIFIYFCIRFLKK